MAKKSAPTARASNHAKTLSPAHQILRSSLLFLHKHKAVYAGIMGIYGAVTLLLVRGFSGSQDLATFREILDATFSGAAGKLQGLFYQLTFLFGGGETVSPTSGLYQAIALLLVSLILIWTTRKLLQGVNVTIQQAFYNSTSPLIPFLLIVLFMGIQLLPLSVGSYIYEKLVVSGIAVHAWEIIVVMTISLMLAVWSLYLLTHSLFALIIVTLPEMTPARALRSAKVLVDGRRLLIWKKLLFAIAFCLVSIGMVVSPFILWLLPLATIVFLVVSLIAIALVHVYVYNLYREMIGE